AIGAMGALGLALACIGLFGVVAHAVAQRTREIGVRIALGAQPGGVANTIMRDGMLLVGAGGALGLAGAAGAAQLLRGVLYGASGTGLVFVSVPILLVTVAAFAAWLPARRAATVEPLVALRQE
ncbi:MAG: FtsX-like permease family protein, partial [Vicinamibacterales bacterium]